MDEILHDPILWQFWPCSIPGVTQGLVHQQGAHASVQVQPMLSGLGRPHPAQGMPFQTPARGLEIQVGG